MGKQGNAMAPWGLGLGLQLKPAANPTCCIPVCRCSLLRAMAALMSLSTRCSTTLWVRAWSLCWTPCGSSQTLMRQHTR